MTLGGPGLTMGSPTPVSCKLEVHPTHPGPAPTSPSSPRSLYRHQSSRADPEGPRRPGSGEEPGPELASARVPKELPGRPRCSPTPGYQALLAVPAYPVPQVCRPGMAPRRSPAPGRWPLCPAGEQQAACTAPLKDAPPAVPGSCGSPSPEGPAFH